MKTLKLKLISLIAMVCLVLGLVVVGIYAAEIQYIKLGGNVIFDIGDKTLYLQDVLIKGNDSESAYSLKDKGKFVPGYVEEQFSMNLGEYSNNNNSFEIYYDIINTVDEEGNTYVYGVNATSTQEGVTFDYSIDNEYGVILNGSFGPGEITPETPATSRLTLTVNAPTETVVDLNQITITFTDPVYHDFTFTTDDQTGTATLDSYTGNASEVIIPNTISVLTINDQTLYLKGNQYDVTAIRDGSSDTDGVFYNNSANLKSVTLPEKIQSIGAYAFNSCNGLTSITLPEKIQSIGTYAFYYCINLTNVTLPESITSIGNYAFAFCSYLTEINYNIPSLSDLSGNNYVFANAGRNGTGITVNFGDNVESVPAYLFCPYSGGSYLPNITVVNFSSSITSIGNYAFRDCDNIQTVNYPGTMSQWCAINFGNQYSNPAYYADSLVINGQEISENLDLDGATSITGTYTFAGYDKITSVTLLESLESITGSLTFYDCQNLTEINFNASSFIDLSSSRSIFAGAGQSGIGLTINVGNNVEHIPAYLFSSCSNATTVNFPETLQTIGTYAFYYCINLTNVTLPESITSIGNYAFAFCSYLTEINYNIPSLSDLSGNNYVFANAGRNGTGITVNFGDSVEHVPAYLFCPYSSLYSLNITEVNFSSSITSIGGSAFYGCNNIQTVNYAGTMTQWCAINFGDQYSNPICYAESLVIDGQKISENLDLEGVTNITGSYTFAGCDKITSVTLPESLQSIGTLAFYSCTNLTTVIIESETIYNLATSSSACGYLLQNATTVRVLTDFASDSHSYINTTNFPNVDKDVVIDGKTYWVYTK